MSDSVYKTVDIVGSSSKSIEDAIERAVAKASNTIKNLNWFEVGEVRGHIEDGKVAHYQVAMKLGFRLD
ncbi:MAG: dodecin domain-containing protein [Hyphomicrobiales bacterium]|nr:dodecin domain-containing protein [Hyphomicrobiales bacterium]MCP4997564.1 dodecin domain-containing protein [Hyphomicrobiales bacterium]